MPESDRPLDLLYAVRDVGVAPRRVDALRTRVQTAIQQEIEFEANRLGVAGGRASRRGRRPTVGAFVTALSVAVSIAVAATGITLLSHSRGRTQSGGPTAGQLIAKLAVLRRPQTPADMLPGRLHITNPQGTIIPRLTRLVRTLPDARLFLVVTTPNGHSNPIWSPRLGDQAAIVEISGSHAAQTMPIPAADLTNANEVEYISPTGQQSATQPGAYYVGIVPDGVARVRWTFANNQFEPGAVLDASATSNVAVIRARPDTPPPILRAAWYAPDGQRVATSNRALLAAQAAHHAVLKAHAIRYDLQHAYHADPSLLAAFAVFAITSRTGIKTAAGDIISRPPLSSLPLDVLQGAGSPDQPPQLDPTELRQVITPSGAHVYVIPGRRGLCLATVNSSPFPDGLLTGGSSSCAPTLASAESHGVAFTSTVLGVTTTYEIVPKKIHRITIHTRHGTRTTIPLPDGIYVSPSQRTGQ
jgi:hypothetical protein